MRLQKIGKTALIKIGNDMGLVVDRSRAERRSERLIVTVTKHDDILGVDNGGSPEYIGSV